MNIKDYAKAVLAMNSQDKTNQAIAKLEHGIKHEEKWDTHHKAEVNTLIASLMSGDTDIENLNKY